MKYYTEYTEEKRRYLIRYGKGHNSNWIGYNDCPGKCGEKDHKRKRIFYDTEQMECFRRGTKILIFIIPKGQEGKSYKSHPLDLVQREYWNPRRNTNIKTFVSLYGYTYTK